MARRTSLLRQCLPPASQARAARSQKGPIFPFIAMVARPVGRKEVRESAAAQAAIEKEWEGLRRRKVWQECNVRGRADVIAATLAVRPIASIGVRGGGGRSTCRGNRIRSVTLKQFCSSPVTTPATFAWRTTSDSPSLPCVLIAQVAAETNMLTK